MSHAAAALGVAVLCASGCVWYVPAIVDVRAGADRPGSRRLAATACLTGWGTAALLVPLLLAAAPWALTAAVAAAGAALTGAQAVRGRIRHNLEQREEARRWSALRHVPHAATRTGPSRTAAAWTLAGIALIPGLATALLLVR
ncbi:hypothetical protein [Streptomyces bambusae]|uniref:Uncharacterized protein n=1 Tax=Streptomyces bambusae TaxID=1550616 RepID=A0ABS6Z1C9_9ACTN|nr:hypothetical protein [Streptomyces bambusae]MBW5480621.1 hypothetical protein [Streptomyces bambusae]